MTTINLYTLLISSLMERGDWQRREEIQMFEYVDDLDETLLKMGSNCLIVVED
jgi:hypothetical protein